MVNLNKFLALNGDTQRSVLAKGIVSIALIASAWSQSSGKILWKNCSFMGHNKHYIEYRLYECNECGK